MDQKKLTNILLIILILLLVGVGVYFGLTRTSRHSAEPTKQAVNTEQQTPSASTTKKNNNQTIDWQSLLPEVKSVLLKTNQISKGDLSEVAISKTEDITGDGIPEALVEAGPGVSFHYLTLMMIENNKPIIAKFKDKNGKIFYPEFFNVLEEAGRHGSETKFIRNENAISFSEYYAFNKKSDYCRLNVYQWNPQTKMFEFNGYLSNKFQKSYCSRVCSTAKSKNGLIGPRIYSEFFKNICP